MPTTIGATTFPTGSAMTSLMTKMTGFEGRGFDANRLDATSRRSHGKSSQVREKFQDFAAGTFYREMLKALRSGQKDSKYFNGGQAEKIFRGQFDQQIAEDLARQHGAAFAGPLFDAYSRQSEAGQSEGAQAGPMRSGFDKSSPLPSSTYSSGQVTSVGGAHALDAVA